jgi:hypothetical protein
VGLLSANKGETLNTGLRSRQCPDQWLSELLSDYQKQVAVLIVEFQKWINVTKAPKKEGGRSQQNFFLVYFEGTLYIHEYFF